MRCPKCGAEYVDPMRSCADCNVALVSEEAYRKQKDEEQRLRKKPETEEFVSILTADDLFHAERVKQVLDENAIPHVVKRRDDSAFAGIYARQEIAVPPELAARARDLVGHLGRDPGAPATGGETGDSVQDQVGEPRGFECSGCGADVSETDTVCPACGRPLAGEP